MDSKTKTKQKSTICKKPDSIKDAEIDSLKTEIKLLEYASKLCSALRLDFANYEVALEALEQIFQLKINAYLLKKNPQVVNTIYKVTKYIGNGSEWNLSNQKDIEFKKKTLQIRLKAYQLFLKFMSFFIVPVGETFVDVFNKELTAFEQINKSFSDDAK